MRRDTSSRFTESATSSLTDPVPFGCLFQWNPGRPDAVRPFQETNQKGGPRLLAISADLIVRAQRCHSRSSFALFIARGHAINGHRRTMRDIGRSRRVRLFHQFRDDPCPPSANL